MVNFAHVPQVSNLNPRPNGPCYFGNPAFDALVQMNTALARLKQRKLDMKKSNTLKA
jgi:hypothetical protein